jgi:arylsulfatase A-like enzyme
VEKSVKSIAPIGLMAAWAAAVGYGGAVALLDCVQAVMLHGVGCGWALLAGFRTAAITALPVGVFASAVLCLLIALARLKPGLVSMRFEVAIILGAGVLPVAFVGFMERSVDPFHALAKTELFGGTVVLVVVGILARAMLAIQRPDRLYILLRRFCLLGTLVILLLSGLSVVAPWQPRIGTARALPQKPGNPNIVLVIIDSARADHFSVYGYRRRTSPFLDSLAAESTIFDNAIAASPWTLPSHASIFTGLYPGQHHTHAEHFWLDDTYRTVAEILDDNGYQTVVFSNNDYVSAVTNMVQGFQRCWYKGHWTDDFRHNGQSIGNAFESLWGSFYSECNEKILSRFVRNPANALDYPTAAVTNSAIMEWLEKGWDRNRPFFLCVNYMDVHFPYNPKDEAARLFMDEVALGRSYNLKLRRPPVEYCLDVRKGQYTSEELGIINALYDADIHSLDAELEKLCAKLRALGMYDKTAIIITSDHGEYLGTHNRLAHGVDLNEEVLRVPMLARYPGVFSAGRRVRGAVSHVDLFETILSLARVEERPRGMPETQKLFSVPEESNRFVFSECRFPLHVLISHSLREDNSGLLVEKKAIRDRNHKLIWKSRGALEFYDLTEDPFELRSRYSEENEKVQSMKHKLFKWMESDIPLTGNKPVNKRGSPIEDIRLLEQMRTLGYVR